MKSRKSTEKGAEHAVRTALILAAANGSDKAFGELVKLYRPLLDSALSPYRDTLSNEDFEELSQEALLSFHRATLGFDPFYGNVSFGAYAKICVGNGIADALRRLSRSRRINTVPLDDLSEGLQDPSDPAGDVIAEESAKELRSLIRSSLSPFENTVWWSYYSGMSCADIATATGRNEKSVSNALSRVRTKLRKLLS